MKVALIILELVSLFLINFGSPFLNIARTLIVLVAANWAEGDKCAWWRRLIYFALFSNADGFRYFGWVFVLDVTNEG